MFDLNSWNNEIFIIRKSDIENKWSTICVCKIVLQKFNIKIKKSNRNINISNISDLTFDAMCFSLEKTMTMTLSQMNQQSISSLKQLANKISEKVMTICEGPLVNYKINKISVVKSSMHRTYLCVSWWRRRNVFPHFRKHMW